MLPVANDTITMVGGAVLTIAGMFGLLKKFPQIGRIVPVAEKVVEDAVKVGEDVLGLPGMEGVKASMHVELSHVKAELQKSQVLQVVGSALHSFGKAAEALSANEKSALVTFAVAELKKKGYEVSSTEITTAVEEIQKAANAFADSSLFKTAQRFDSVQQATQQSATADNKAAK